MDQVYVVVSIALAGLVLLGIRWMSSPRTAVRGNRLSALAMFIAVVLTLWNNRIMDVYLLWVAASNRFGHKVTGVRAKDDSDADKW